MSFDKENTEKYIGLPAGLPFINEYQVQQQEIAPIVIKLQRLLQELATPCPTGITYIENEFIDSLAPYFDTPGLPAQNEPHPGPPDQLLANKIILVLKYLVAENDLPYSGDALLFELLHFDWFGIAPSVIALLSIEAGNRRISIRQLLYEKANAVAQDLFAPAPEKGLQKASRLLEELIADFSVLSMKQSFENIIRKASVPNSFRQEAATDPQPQTVTRLAAFARPGEEFMSRLLHKFVMSATALNNYLHCPLEFYFKNLIRVPSPKNEAMGFGSSVHYALESFFRKMQEGRREQFCDKQEFIADFEWSMQQHRQRFTKLQFDRRMLYGQEVLSNYYDHYINSFHTIVAIERNIQNVVVGGVPLKGKLDKLEFDGRMVKVIDYKTGDPDKAMARLQPPNDQQPNGGDYWRQAVFYKLLVDNYEQKGWKVLSTEFDFIEPDKMKNYRREKLVISPADITTVTQQISNSWQGIQNREFYTGCGEEDCHWCNFVKMNKLAVS